MSRVSYDSITRPFRVAVHRECNLRTDVNEYTSCPLLLAQTQSPCHRFPLGLQIMQIGRNRAPVLTQRRPVESQLLHWLARSLHGIQEE